MKISKNSGAVKWLVLEDEPILGETRSLKCSYIERLLWGRRHVVSSTCTCEIKYICMFLCSGIFNEGEEIILILRTFMWKFFGFFFLPKALSDTFLFLFMFRVSEYQSFNQPTNQPTNQPINQSTNQPTNQPTNEPANQPINQSTNQPTN